MSQSGEGLLNGLKNVRWNIAAKTFGNNHATLIGLLVQWWIDSCPEMPQVLEAGPSHGHFKNGVGGGMCDAVFCDNSNAVGILEVEGTRYPHTFEKIGKFFNNPSAYPDLRFAVVVLYPTGPKGRGGERTMPKLEDVKVSSMVEPVSRRHSGKTIVVVVLDKAYERDVEGVRGRNDYYKSNLTKVRALVYEGGMQVASGILW